MIKSFKTICEGWTFCDGQTERTEQQSDQQELMDASKISKMSLEIRIRNLKNVRDLFSLLYSLSIPSSNENIHAMMQSWLFGRFKMNKIHHI